MPTAICSQCSEVVHWRNQRGVRLADLRCKCGGALKAARYAEGGRYGPIPTRRGPKRQRVVCALCARHRMFPSTAVRSLKEETVFRVWGDEGGKEFRGLGYHNRTIQAGSFVCAWHERVGSIIHIGEAALGIACEEAYEQALEE